MWTVWLQVGREWTRHRINLTERAAQKVLANLLGAGAVAKIGRE